MNTIQHVAIKIRTPQGWVLFPTIKGNNGLTAYEVAVQDGFVGSVQDWLNSLIGPQGTPGVQGPQGPQGPQGSPGLSGNSTEFVFCLSSTNSAPPNPAIPPDPASSPYHWLSYPSGVSDEAPYEWVSKRERVNGEWGAYSTPALWASYVQGSGSEYTLPKASGSILGGIKVGTNLSIDEEGILSASGSGGGISDIVPEETPKYYARYSTDPPTWVEVLPPSGSVGNLQQVTANGASTNVLVSLVGGVKVNSLLQLPSEAPSNLDEGKWGIYMGSAGFSGQIPPSLPIASAGALGAIRIGANLSIDPSTGILSAQGGGGEGVTDHAFLTGRDTLESHPTSAISGLDIALQNLFDSLGNLATAISNHTTNENAHSSLFGAKANKNGDANEDFAAKDINAQTITMVENINTNLRIPNAPPTNPTPGVWYFYIQ